MKPKAKLNAPIWARIQRGNRDWIDSMCKRLGYSRSEFLDLKVTEARDLQTKFAEEQTPRSLGGKRK